MRECNKSPLFIWLALVALLAQQATFNGLVYCRQASVAKRQASSDDLLSESVTASSASDSEPESAIAAATTSDSEGSRGDSAAAAAAAADDDNDSEDSEAPGAGRAAPADVLDETQADGSRSDLDVAEHDGPGVDSPTVVLTIHGQKRSTRKPRKRNKKRGQEDSDDEQNDDGSGGRGKFTAESGKIFNKTELSKIMKVVKPKDAIDDNDLFGVPLAKVRPSNSTSKGANNGRDLIAKLKKKAKEEASKKDTFNGGIQFDLNNSDSLNKMQKDKKTTKINGNKVNSDLEDDMNLWISNSSDSKHNKSDSKKQSSSKKKTGADFGSLGPIPTWRPWRSTQRPGTRTPPKPSVPIWPDFESITKKPTEKPTNKPTEKPSEKCPSKESSSPCYKDARNSDQLLALVLTRKGGFKGRKIGKNAIQKIMNQTGESQEKANKTIVVSEANSFVFPAGHYYFAHPIRFAGFISP